MRSLKTRSAVCLALIVDKPLFKGHTSNGPKDQTLREGFELVVTGTFQPI